MNIDRNKDGALRIPDGAAQQLFTNRHIDYQSGCYVTVKQSNRVNAYILYSKSGEMLDAFEDNLGTTFNSRMADDVDYDVHRKQGASVGKRIILIILVAIVITCVLSGVAIVNVIKGGL